MTYKQSTYLTKKQFAESLKKSILCKPLSKITVSEIIADCGVNRKTFYYHFENIHALLKWMFQQEALEVVKQFDLLVDIEEAILCIMDYVEKNSYILNCAHDTLGSDELKRFFAISLKDITKSVIDQLEVDSGSVLDTGYKDFLCQFYIGAMANMLIDWIQNRDQQDWRAILDYFSLTVRGSILGISQLRRAATGTESQ